MDEHSWDKIETIVDQALTLSSEDRKKFINRECKGDKVLKTEVTELLQSIIESEGWLENPGDYKDGFLQELTEDIDGLSSSGSLIGTTIGAYTVKKKVGEGGMGTVYLAERSDEEFDHEVAIKIIRNEKASAKNIERFRQERTILAGLNHPGIAKLFDGGVTEDGFPYFIMEYVNGMPIDQYCQQHGCSLEKRISLFKKVLKAVRHAHENLVVHRDLKPGNILVNKNGDIKILDFGISKFLDKHTTNPVTTQTNARLLTPKYAAPEQILQNSLTTAVDIYALGTVLFKILTKNLPFDLDDLSQFEIEQAVLEQAPARPSQRVSSSNLKQKLKGDLDAITLKALRKEPELRYRTANEFLDDLENYQRDLPISAQEDSLRYRTRKFYSRNKKGIGIAVGIFLLIIGLTSFYTWRITQERNRAQIQSERAEEMTDFLLSLFEANNPREGVGKDLPASVILEKGLKKLQSKPMASENKAMLLAAIGQIQMKMGQLDEAAGPIKNAYTLLSDSLTPKTDDLVDINTVYANWQRSIGNTDSAITLYKKADSLHRAIGTTNSEAYRINMHNLAYVYNTNKDFEKALSILNNTSYAAEPQTKDEFHNKSYYYNSKAIAFAGLGNYEKAIQFYEKSLELREQIYSADNPELALAYQNIAVVYLRQNLYRRAYDLFKKAYHIRKKTIGPDHQLVGSTLSGLAVAANEIGKPVESEQYHKKCIQILKKQHGTNHYRYALGMRNYANFLIDAERFKEAEQILQTSHDIIVRNYGESHPLHGYVTNSKADLYRSWNQPEKAEQYYEKTYSIFEKRYGPDHLKLAQILYGHAKLKFKETKYDSALTLLKESNKIYETNNQDNSLLYGKNLYLLGKSEMQLSNNEKARTYLENAAQIIRQTKSDTARTLIEIKDLLSELKPVL